MNKKLKKFLVILVGGIVLLVISLEYANHVDPVPPSGPELFDINDPQNTYTISTIGPHYSILVINTQTEKKVEVMLGASHFSLEDYVGKSVEVAGEFKEGVGKKDISCIPAHEQECTDSFRAVVFVIDTITIVE